jgi:thiol-disulfide isomerase/thioredoxin
MYCHAIRKGANAVRVIFNLITSNDHMNRSNWLLLLAFVLSLFQTVQAESKSTAPGVKPFSPLGHWRGVFQVREGVTVPFNFDIVRSAGVQKAFFINGSERFEAGRVTQTADSLFIAIDAFDNELAFKIGDSELKGVLRKQDKTGNSLPLVAERGKNYRFAEGHLPSGGTLSGTYDIRLQSGNGQEEKAVGLFTQKGNHLYATFLRISGDSRFLEGTVDGNEFYLSGFIGSVPSYYKGTFTPDGHLKGEIIGVRSSQPFSGTTNEEAALPDAYGLTFLKNGYTTLDFSFPDVNGHKVSLADKKFDNKVVIIAITGTWCPNCIDEASFLAPWYINNRKRGVEIVALHYERKTDTAFVRKVLTRFRDRFGIRYDQLFVGTADKASVAASLPALNTFLAFPTMIILDKSRKVVQIHTGYSGPATGKYYEAFIKEFNAEMDSLLKQ